MAEYERKKVDLDALSQAVLEIKKSDVQEVKSFANPPIGVIKVACAISLLIGDDNKNDGTWKSAKKKLADTNLLKNIARDFDMETVKPETVLKAKQTLEGLDLDTVQKQNTATVTLYNWATGVIEEIEASGKNK